jgi:hypothetical protein
MTSTFKVLITMKRRADISRQAFVDYYNEKHLAYGASVMPPLAVGAKLHRRNFVTLDDPFLAVVGDGRAVTENPDFDAVTEMLFDSREDAITMMRAFFQPDVIAKVKEDERNFVEVDSIRFYVVEVHENTLS